MRQTYKVLIDTDIGDDIDDALALALALRCPEIELQAVTTVFGDTWSRARLAAHLLHIFERPEVPVAAGIAMPLQLRHQPSGVPQAAILDPDASFPALSATSGPALIVKIALASPGQLTLLCLGPLTNVATALQLEPRIFMAIRSIVLMGGTSGVPFPEWNMRSDVGAAHIVLAAGIPITMIGWNVTTRCQMHARDVEQLHRAASPQTRLLSTLLAVWQRNRPRWYPTLPYLHDPLTIVALCHPELMRYKQMTARVLTHGPLSGFMVPRLMDGPLVHAAVEIQAEQARAWIMQRLLS